MTKSQMFSEELASTRKIEALRSKVDTLEGASKQLTATLAETERKLKTSEAEGLKMSADLVKSAKEHQAELRKRGEELERAERDLKLQKETVTRL